MAQKKVSVRLVAEGGRQVKAEFQGVGDAGEASFRRIERQADVTGAVLRRLAGIVAGALSVRQIVAYADSWTDLRSRVDLATGSQERGAAVMERLAAMARRTYSGIEQTTESWLANATALRELGLSTRESLDFTEALNNAMVVSGAKGERAVSVQTALARAMALGQLSGDNLNTVIAQGGRVAQLLAADLGTTVTGLRQAGAEGRITGAVIQTALIGNLERLREEADGMPATIGDAFTLIGNAAMLLVGTWDQVFGASSLVATALIAVADNMERLAAIGIAFAGFMAGRWVAAFLAARVATLTLSGALTVLRGAIVRTGIGALIVLAGELIYQLMTVVQKVGGLGEAFRLVADLAAEAWNRMGLRLDAVMASISAAWEGLKATIFTLLDDTLTGVVSFGDRTIAVFQGAYDGAVAIWGSLPGAIGDFAFQAANGLISGVEAMLNGVVTRINSFIGGLNAALELLPDWAVGDGGVRIGTLDPVALGRVANPFEGAATAAGTAAADAFNAAMGKTYVTAPDTGLGAMAEAARGRAEGYREAAGMLADAASRPMASWQALKDAVTGVDDDAGGALDDAAGGALELGHALDGATGAAGRAGAAGRQAGAEAAAGAETAVTGWAAVSATLADYAAKARDIGGDIGTALVGAFQGAENAIGEFVKTGKLSFRDLVTSLIADLAKLAARRFILGPIANALSGALGGAEGIFADVLHAGGVVGAPGPGRMVPTLAFAGAPRMHNGGWAGLRPDEVPAILQRGERVLSRREAAGYGGASAPTVNVTINARDAESFRQSRTQIAADIARAVSLGRRGM
ncbi:phage tail tape measure protein [Paracoccus suum]|uniref:Phage tail tape-measure protein n=2 Tax=Paracoccus TaxID=265 RepID=A0A1W6CZN9_9RHOB|nr:MULTISPECIES: tape measure protein [Paracoccus]ARJ70318.1 phage tail tape-measure protein [Paracoccus contaminans]AXC50800.1 phage tail tape measure protein [Paracoccus suum]